MRDFAFFPPGAYAHAHAFPIAQRAGKQPHQRRAAQGGVVLHIEHHAAGRAFAIPSRRRQEIHNGVQQFAHALAPQGAAAQRGIRRAIARHLRHAGQQGFARGNVPV